MNEACPVGNLKQVTLDSIWQRIMWDFLVQNPQLEEWLEGSRLQATDEPDLFRLVIANAGAAEWLGVHTFAIRRSLSVEMRRDVEVRVVTGEAVTK